MLNFRIRNISGKKKIFQKKTSIVREYASILNAYVSMSGDGSSYIPSLTAENIVNSSENRCRNLR